MPGPRSSTWIATPSVRWTIRSVTSPAASAVTERVIDQVGDRLADEFAVKLHRWRPIVDRDREDEASVLCDGRVEFADLLQQVRWRDLDEAIA